MLLNQSKFAQAVNLSRNAISKAVREGKVVLNENKMIDTDDKVNKIYIYGDSKKKSAFFRYKKKFETSDEEEKPEKSVKKRSSQPKPKKEPEVVKKEIPKMVAPEESETMGPPTTIGDIAEQKQIVSLKIEQEKYIKFAIANQLAVNKTASRDGLQFVTERFINHFVTAIKRVASTSLTDISKAILAEGKIENHHFSHFEDACLEMVHDSKTKLLKDMSDMNI